MLLWMDALWSCFLEVCVGWVRTGEGGRSQGEGAGGWLGLRAVQQSAIGAR